MEIEVGNSVFKQQPSGEWTFKAKESDIVNTDDRLKPQYKELPQFDLIYDIDAHMRGQMDNEVKTAIKEILTILK